MEDRGFSEVELRAMMEGAMTHRPDVFEGRFVLETAHRGAPWEVIVEPDREGQLLVVITAYGVSR